MEKYKSRKIWGRKIDHIDHTDRHQKHHTMEYKYPQHIEQQTNSLAPHIHSPMTDNNYITKNNTICISEMS